MATATGTAAATGHAMTGIAIIPRATATMVTITTTIIAAGTKLSGAIRLASSIKKKTARQGGFFMPVTHAHRARE